MIRSKIFYSLCIAVICLPFAEAMYMTDKLPTSTDDKQLTNWNSVETTKLINRFNNRLSNNDRHQLINTHNSQIKNLRQVDTITHSINNLTKDLKNRLNKNTQEARLLSEDVEKSINLLTHIIDHESISLLTCLIAYGGRHDEIKATLEKKFVHHTAEMYSYLHFRILQNVNSCSLFFLDIDALDLLTEQNKEFIRKEVRNYDITKDRAKELLKAIDRTSYNEYTRKELEMELLALGICRRNKWINHGDAFLKIQLEAFLVPNKYETWPRNDYNEIVWKSTEGDPLGKLNKILNYLCPISGAPPEIETTFTNAFMRTLTPRTVLTNIGNSIFCEESFNKIATSLELTDFEKNRLIRNIRCYKTNMGRLVAFLSKGGWEPKEICFIFEEIYPKKYQPATIRSWMNETHRPQGLSSIFAIPLEDLANELNALWTCHTSADSEKDKENCEFVKNLLKMYNVKAQKENNDCIEMELAKDDNNHIYNDNMYDNRNNINNVMKVKFDNHYNNCNYEFGMNYNNNPQINVVNNSNFLQNNVIDQIHTKTQENNDYMNNENIEAEDKYDSSDLEKEEGFMQYNFYKNNKL